MELAYFRLVGKTEATLTSSFPPFNTGGRVALDSYIDTHLRPVFAVGGSGVATRFGTPRTSIPGGINIPLSEFSEAISGEAPYAAFFMRLVAYLGCYVIEDARGDLVLIEPTRASSPITRDGTPEIVVSEHTHIIRTNVRVDEIPSKTRNLSELEVPSPAATETETTTYRS